MKVEDLAAELGLSPLYIKKRFKYIKTRYALSGVEILKNGREPNAEYGIKYAWENSTRWERKDAKTN